jgi:class I fructose-bisphosphate aldolase
MEARTGKRIAAGRLFDPASGRAVVVARSHGVPLDPAPGQQSLDRLRAAAARLSAAAALALREGEAP